MNQIDHRPKRDEAVTAFISRILVSTAIVAFAVALGSHLQSKLARTLIVLVCILALVFIWTDD
ncbi:MAG: hypothetical protein KGI45_03605 [Patescibacteria group bacterium]|nr:hypothetical protein [Patescibacteria group bacterium]